MNVTKKKKINIALIFTLIVSLLLPQAAFAKEIKGDEDNPSLTIHKFEQEPGTAPGEDGTGLPGQNAEGDPVEGVTFTLKQTHQYNSETDKWTEVADGKTIEKQTGEDGIVVFTKADELELGRYEVTETDGPANVILNPDPFFVDIPMTNKDRTTLNYDVHVYPKNETVRSAVEIVKKDEDGNPLPGVSFILYNEDGTLAVDKEGNEIGELTTNEAGKIKVDGLAQGKYYFQETKAPEGYALNTTRIPFEVKKAGENLQDIVVEWTTVDGIVDENGVVTNYNTPEIDKDANGEKKLDFDRNKEYKYNLTIKTPKDINKYKALGVTDTLDERLEFVSEGSIDGGWKIEGTNKSNVDFKQKGQTLIWEIKDPSQLTPGEDVKITFTAKIKPDAELKEGEIGIENTADLHFNNNKGSYTRPADPDNPDPYEPYDPEDPDEPNEPGEPIEPPNPEEPPVVVPTEGGIDVIKVDASDNNVKLKGAEFKLTDMDGNVIDTSNAGEVVKVNGEAFNGKLENLVTGEDGTFSITGLTPGTYQLHETKAPTYTTENGEEKPYRLLSKPVEVKVENNKELSYEVENSKSLWELPTTGGIGTIIFTLIGLTLMGMALALYFRRRKLEAIA
ncbi:MULTISPECIES: SpaH/EbpB family LPXTG-anchored major pilin [Virgibacillus]|uniref:SpaH/EbpB family LPXTG-anchored major pilin n=1 Tax=Virgibacillus dokdonensis TaxID=302167 RepID=A0ABU7VIP2_9BACI|nr:MULTISPECIES: SpaH/EbpB family LPXTG-anchored major pilin [Virgibacillus]NWO12612.1 SpaH/EbpB family LPXTG-anchored major pilin [Virgibacillus sp.]